jgi:hypothetical protein
LNCALEYNILELRRPPSPAEATIAYGIDSFTQSVTDGGFRFLDVIDAVGGVLRQGDCACCFQFRRSHDHRWTFDDRMSHTGSSIYSTVR